MKFCTKRYEIGEDIQVPSGAVNPQLSISQDTDPEGSHPVAILSYIELTDDELREAKARAARGPQGATLIG